MAYRGVLGVLNPSLMFVNVVCAFAFIEATIKQLYRFIVSIFAFAFALGIASRKQGLFKR